MALTLSLLILCVGCDRSGAAGGAKKTVKAVKSGPEGVEQPKDAAKVKEGLEQFLAGKLEGKDLSLRYSDRHPIHGGLEMIIKGDGSATIFEGRKGPPEGQKSSATAAEVKALVKLMQELKAWEQHNISTGDPENVRRTDQSYGFVTIKVGEATTTIREYHQTRVRTLKVMKEMKAVLGLK